MRFREPDAVARSLARNHRAHTCRDHLLRAQTIPVGGRERRPGVAAVDERGQFGCIGGSKAVDELRKRALVIAHGERPINNWLAAASAAVSFDDDVKLLLVEAAYVNLSFLAENHSLNTISGYVIPAHLNLGGHLAVEPKIKQRVIEVLLAGGETMAIEA